MYPNWILQRAYLTPNRIGLTFEGKSWSFEQLKQISIKRAYQLTSLGIEEGSRVAIMGQNHPRLIFMILACMHLKCEMVLLNRKLTKEELDYQIKDAKASVVIVDEEDEHLLPQMVNKLSFLAIGTKS